MTIKQSVSLNILIRHRDFIFYTHFINMLIMETIIEEQEWEMESLRLAEYDHQCFDDEDSLRWLLNLWRFRLALTVMMKEQRDHLNASVKYLVIITPFDFIL